MKSFQIDKNLLIHIAMYLLLLLTLLGLIAGIYTGHQMLSQKSRELDHLKIDNELTEQKIIKAKTLSKNLELNQENVARAAVIVADTKSYEYQDQIVEDISSYAASANITILGFDFESTPQTTTPKKVAGLNTVTADITLKNPIPYENYLTFLRLIERNLTKMQVSKLDVSADLKSPGSINSPSISVEVYVK